jgi:hypothetical protein
MTCECVVELVSLSLFVLSLSALTLKRKENVRKILQGIFVKIFLPLSLIVSNFLIARAFNVGVSARFSKSVNDSLDAIRRREPLVTEEEEEITVEI